MKKLHYQPNREPISRDSSGFCNKPHLANLLRMIRLDVVYHRGRGDFLYYHDDDDREVEVLDLMGGYGSLLLGHSHPVLVNEARDVLASERPNHTQGSLRLPAELLAQELSRRADGDFRVVFANSGAEAVEAAIKHAILETGSRKFLALEGAFHGKTLGALQLNGSAEHREPFEMAGLDVVRIRLNDIASLEEGFAAADDLAGFIFEPIQGEGGIREIEPEFAKRAGELCEQRGVPLIADECQTGMGRSGEFLACERLGVRPDYIILSKALGGGLAKISALLIHRKRYIEAFDLKHTSTYAEDDYSCAIALKTLEILDEATIDGCRERGEYLLERLNGLKHKYSDIILDVRGRGLMVGIEFRRLSASSSFLLRYLSSLEHLVYVLAGYLFNVHQIRVAPTLSDPFTMRVEPSALIRERDIDRFIQAMDDVCGRLQSNDIKGLTAFLSDGDRDRPAGTTVVRSDWKLIPADEAEFARSEKIVPPIRVAWLFHLIDANDFAALEPSFGEMTLEARENCLNRFDALANPIVMNSSDIRSQSGDVVRLHPILLPVTSRWMKERIDSRKLRMVRSLVQKGVDVAQDLNCSVVSLGQYTSITTLNGTKVSAPGLGLTTGNSYALALAIQAIQRAHDEGGTSPAESVLAIVGATGNIGRTCAQILAKSYRRVILVGSKRRGARGSLQALSNRFPNASITTDLARVSEADTVLAAVNAVDTPLGPDHFAPNAIVCDLSVPPSVKPETSLLRPDLVVIKGGIASLPYGEDLDIVGFPLSAGLAYGCLAEGILLGFEGLRDATFTGSLTPVNVRRIEDIARRHGFELADEESISVLGSETWEKNNV